MSDHHTLAKFGPRDVTSALFTITDDLIANLFRYDDGGTYSDHPGRQRFEWVEDETELTGPIVVATNALTWPLIETQRVRDYGCGCGCGCGCEECEAVVMSSARPATQTERWWRAFHDSHPGMTWKWSEGLAERVPSHFERMYRMFSGELRSARQRVMWSEDE